VGGGGWAAVGGTVVAGGGWTGSVGSGRLVSI